MLCVSQRGIEITDGRPAGRFARWQGPGLGIARLRFDSRFAAGRQGTASAYLAGSHGQRHPAGTPASQSSRRGRGGDGRERAATWVCAAGQPGRSDPAGQAVVRHIDRG